ncbi:MULTISPECIES: toxin VasX [unclassified Pseudomonas]|uniref:toxin VasX n=2 Tax=Pseudomonas TaxID=286 RepID=UPI0015B74D33|nr:MULTISPECIES: toxin VasX [unclassified Pseudomonas]
MSLDKSLATLVNLAEARRAASACEHVDINSTVQQCPASQPHLFVVPVRYALSEEPASHPACQPGTQTQSHPMAARLLRAGFVYVWQGRGPLQRYAVAENNLLLSQGLDEDDTVVQSGTLSGLALAKQQDAWLLYSEIPLNPAACADLHDPQQRAKRMRQLDLRQVANMLQAPHCVPLSESKSVMAELIPDTYDLSMAIDYQRHQPALRASADQLGKKVMAAPTPDNIKAYTDAMHWLHEREKASAGYPAVSDDVTPPGEWSAEQWTAIRTQDLMEQAHVQARGLFTVLACLDDDLGILRDINHEQELIESRHEQWQADNNLRLSIGGFVRSLITEDPDEVIGMLVYRYREQDIELTREQAQMLLNARTRLEQLARQRYTANIRRGTTHSNLEADTRLAEIHLREQAAVAPIRGFIPLQLHDEVLQVVRDYQESKVNNLRNKHTSDKVEKYIDLPAMNYWLDKTAPRHFDHLKERHETLYADRGTYLSRHHSGTWFVDYQDSDHRQWLDELALACLSAQCLRTVGAEQYADYVRSADDGALRQLFYGWSPTLEGAVNTNSRATELMAALEVENQANAMAALSKALGPQGINILSNLSVISNDANSLWSVLIKRLSASLLLLSSKVGEPLKGPWLAMMTVVRVANQIGLRLIIQGKHQVLQQFGKAAEDLAQWVNTTGKAIGRGHIAKIVDSPAVKNSGGLIALTALLLNSWNASNYLGQAGVLEGMDQQRVYDTASATLYAGAALVAVIDNQVRGGFKERAFIFKTLNNSWAAVPVLTLFGGVIGGLSAGAAAMEFLSLQKQIENAHGTIDPWLKMRRNIVGGQVIAFATQAMLGLIYTFRAVSGGLTVSAAVGGYLLWMGPLNLLIAVLGVLYLIAWYFQQTPMQSLLNNCCWAKSRARDLNPISLDAQQDELNRLYGILYVPRISFESVEQSSVMSSLQSGVASSPIKKLTIDLPGAEPSNVYLEISMVGNPLDTLAMRERIKSGERKYSPEEPMQDIGSYWMHASRCEWIPPNQGQGLRLSGPFNTVPDLYGSKPTTVFLRLRYNTPLTSMLGLHNFVGGDRGVAFTLSSATGVIALRNDPAPELDIAKRYPLGGQQCSIFLQPGIKR